MVGVAFSPQWQGQRHAFPVAPLRPPRKLRPGTARWCKEGIAASNVKLWTLLTVSCLNLLSYTAMYPMTPKLMSRFAVHSDVGVGLVASSFALGRFCTTSLWPILSDYIGRKKVLFMALLGGAAGSALQGIAIACHWPFSAFLAVRGVAGMFSGIVPTVKAYIVDTFEAEEVPKVLAYREAAGTMAFILGPALGGFLAARIFAAPMFFSAFMSTWAAVLCLKVLPDPSGPRPQSVGLSSKTSSKTSSAKHAKPKPILAVPLFLFSFIWACTRTCFHSYFPLLLTRRFELPLTRLGAVLTGISFLVAIVQVCAFEFCRKRYGLERTMVLGTFMVISGLGNLVISPPDTTLPWLFASAALYGAGSALVSPALPASLIRYAPEGRTGAFMGIDSVIVNFGRIVAPSVFGLLLFSNYVGICMGPVKVVTVASAFAWLFVLVRR